MGFNRGSVTMNCKHKIIKGNTTKYFWCNLKEKSIDDYQCRDYQICQKDLKKYLERGLEDDRLERKI